ncbi:MAG TPA: DUF3300 domain-containing protein, partial [Acetobacteraceae bacterium]|nr:DUF3300 domain-containing protein [Acetobacteraceae bacterium]
LDRHNNDKALKPPSDWDPSVVALLNYPDVLAMMNSDLDWTQQLGNAVIAQQADVLNAIQAFRKTVYDAGNLKSNDQQSVKVENQTVIVQSADPQTIYVPEYDPQVVVAPVAVGAPLPYAYSPPYPYYASPAATFATGAVFGAAVGFSIGWASHGIYSGNWGWGGDYGGGNVNVNRTNNVNINNTRLTDAQRTQFNNRVTQNQENAWRPDRTATARQQASLGPRGQAGRVNSADIQSGLAGKRPGTAGGTVSPQARQNAQRGLENRTGGPPNRQPGAGPANRAPAGAAGNRPSPGGGQGQGGTRPAQQPGRPALQQGARPPAQQPARPAFQQPARPAVQQSGGAFSGFQNGGAADRYSNRGAASLRSSNGFAGGGRPQMGGGRPGGGGFHGRR